MTEQAPFIPTAPDDEPIPQAPWRVFRSPGFAKLITAQFASSLGDWTGLFAVISIASGLSANAVGLVMIARMLPGFLLAPFAGAFIDRWNRKVLMVTCDIGRAGLLVVLPFWDHMLGLVVISFSIEVLTLLWGPAKDASVPNVVNDPAQLASANSLGLVAAFGTMPLGSVMYALLAAVASWLGHFHELSRFRVEQESLAIWVDASTFLVSALLISRLVIPNGERDQRERPPASQTWRDMVEGLKFIRSNALVRGVMVGIAGGLLGGGAVIPLGALFTKQVMHASASAYGFLATALGVGAAIGVVTLLYVQRHLPRAGVFVWSVVTTGSAMIAVAFLSSLAPAIVLIAVFGASAGCGYVTGFTLLQECVSDELRGRTFATLYTVVRLCLLLSLTISPFIASALGAISDELTSGGVHIGSAHLSLPGVRLALWLGGAFTVLSGLAAQRRMYKATHADMARQ